jgi:hypothetical protein
MANTVKECFTWSNYQEKWSFSNYTWNDVCLLVKLVDVHSSGGGVVLFSNPKQNLSPKEYTRFVKIVCKVNNITTELQKERKLQNKPIITVSEIKKLENDFNKFVKINGISLDIYKKID